MTKFLTLTFAEDEARVLRERLMPIKWRCAVSRRVIEAINEELQEIPRPKPQARETHS